MKLFNYSSSKRHILLVAAVFALLATTAQAVSELWSAKLKNKPTWYQITELGTLLIGTQGAVHSYDPDTGDLMWSRDDLDKTSEFSLREVSGTPYLLGNYARGMGGTKIIFFGADYLSGETLWTTEELMGQYLAAYPIPSQGLALFVYNSYAGSKDEKGMMLRAHDLATGELKWQTRYDKANGVPLHMADNTGRFSTRMDLSGYHDPVIDGDVAYLGFRGVDALDLTTGEILWTQEFKPGHKDWKRTYAPIRVEGDRVYGAGGGSVFVFNKTDGSVKWKSDRISSYAGLFKSRDNAIVS